MMMMKKKMMMNNASNGKQMAEHLHPHNPIPTIYKLFVEQPNPSMKNQKNGKTTWRKKSNLLLLSLMIVWLHTHLRPKNLK